MKATGGFTNNYQHPSSAQAQPEAVHGPISGEEPWRSIDAAVPQLTHVRREGKGGGYEQPNSDLQIEALVRLPGRALLVLNGVADKPPEMRQILVLWKCSDYHGQHVRIQLAKA